MGVFGLRQEATVIHSIGEIKLEIVLHLPPQQSNPAVNWRKIFKYFQCLTLDLPLQLQHIWNIENIRELIYFVSYYKSLSKCPNYPDSI